MKERWIERKIEALGFKKVYESEDLAVQEYERFNDKYKYTQVICIRAKIHNNEYILLSYDKDLFDNEKIGNTCVGLNYRELKIFTQKIKKMMKHKVIKEQVVRSYIDCALNKEM